MNRSHSVLVPIAALSLASLSACRTGPPRSADASASPVRVSTTDVRRVSLPSTFEAAGIVVAASSAAIASRVMATATAVHVRAGDRVRRGATLVTLDRAETTANRSRAMATLASTIEAVSAADGAVKSAEAAMTSARLMRDRLQSLHEKRAATTEERDKAVSAFEAAAGGLQTARANLAAAKASQQAAAAGLEAADAQSTYSTLLAPFDGLVTARLIDPGDMVSPGAALLTIEDTTAFRIETTVDEGRAAYVALGQSAQVAAGDSDEWLKTAVTELARVSPESHAFLVTLALPPGPTLRSGSFYRVRFAGPPNDALVVPATAVLRRGQLAFVFVVDEERRARLQPVSAGTRIDDVIEILSGLPDGTRVVAHPPAALADDTSIIEAAR
jgi:RND family efflux transporter MFP subunit